MHVLEIDFGRPLWMWAVFLTSVLLLIIFDLGVLQRGTKDREISIKESLWLSSFYISMGLIFGAFVWNRLGAQAAKDYYTGFIVEKSLSLDNIFVISLVFSYFAIPRARQYRVLFWGVIGVIILRGLLIGIGATLVEDFEWVLYLFAAFLIFTGIKMLRNSDEETNIADNFVLKTVTKYMLVTKELYGKHFFVRLKDANSGEFKYFATPLFVALLVIEFVDLIFALDSVPAIFTITTDPYVVFTSNIFAILGLRALYFALSAMIHRFEYLKYSLALLLIFIGGKVFVPDIMGWKDLPSSLSLVVTLIILGAGVVYSLVKTKADQQP